MISTSADGAAFPLSHPQREIWYAQQALGDVPFNSACYVDIQGPLDVHALNSAAMVAAREFESGYLRLSAPDGTPLQQVDTTLTLPTPLIDLRGEPDPESAAQAWMRDECGAAIDLLADPLMTLTTLQLDDARHYCYVRVHHIAMDGYGLALFLDRTAEIYNARLVQGTPAPAAAGDMRSLVTADEQYRASGRFAADEEYWLGRTRELPQPATLAMRPGPVAATPLIAKAQLSRESEEAVAHAAARLQTTPSAVVIAAFAAYLARLADTGEVVFSLPVTARTNAPLRRSGGMLSNVLPVRVVVHPGMVVRELVSAVTREISGVLRHQRYRGADLRRKLPHDLHHTFGPSMNIMKFKPEVRLGAVSSQIHVLSSGPVEDLLVNLYTGTDDHTQLDFMANPNRYDAAELQTHLARFMSFLPRFAASESAAVDSLGIFFAAEDAALLPRRGPAAGPLLPLAEIIAAAVAANPAGTAVVCGDRSWTYSEFDTWTDRLAHALLRAGAGPETLVAMMVERAAESVAAVWAIAKTGAAFVPVDPRYPAERIEYILADSGARLGVTTAEARPDGPSTVDWLVLDGPLAGVSSPQRGAGSAAVTDTDRPTRLSAANAAYLIYTSGSTGKPKGVMVTHGGLANLAADRRDRYDFGPSARMLHHASPGFDMAVGEILCALAGRATLIVAPKDVVADEDLTSFMRRQRVTHAIITPAVLATLDPAAVPDLRVLAVGGEAIRTDLVDAWAPGRMMRNGYGPTESTDIATIADLEAGKPVTIGSPVRGFHAVVLDTHLRPVPAGSPGELYLGGPAVARGYHNQSALTASRFIADPFGPAGGRLYRTGDLVSYGAGPDYLLNYHGRNDFQVKVRGHRIELGEIETVLLGCAGVSQAAVIAHRDARTGDRLAAYLVPAAGAALDIDAIRTTVRSTLPGALHPNAFMVLDALPLTPNGKLDQRRLPAPELNQYEAPTTPRELALAQVFADVLGTAPVGIDDNFFARGGTSLLVFTLRTQLSQRLGLDFSPQTLFQHPTVRELASLSVTSMDEVAGTRLALLATDAELDPAIQVADSTAPRSSEVRNILLTGATGFLGVYLLRELLDHTNARIWCVVRASSPVEASARILRELGRYHLSTQQVADRVVALPGDLTQQRLGLSPDDYTTIAAQLDVIYHNGARVNHLEPYETLRAANVDGTVEVLRLAVAGRLKPVHFVSSGSAAIGTGTSPQDLITEDSVVPVAMVPRNGYVASKWVAEQLMLKAAERGVPVAIYRPGLISGDLRTGVISQDDSFWSMIRAAAVLGMAPDVGDAAVSLTPVSYVAQALVQLAAKEPASGCYHLVNRETVRVRDILAALIQHGYPISIVSAAAATERLMEHARAGDVAGDYSLVRAALLASNGLEEGHPSVVFDDANTQRALENSGIVCPRVDAAVIDRYITTFVAAGLLPAPEAVAA